jgi:hypothetical protein
MKRRAGTSFGVLLGALVSAAALGVSLAPAPGHAQGDPSTAGPTGEIAILQYVAPTSGTWGPPGATLPTAAFGRPAEVLLVVPDGYVVRQRVPVAQAIQHATYVSQQIGQPIAVMIPDPAGGPPRLVHVGTPRNDR